MRSRNTFPRELAGDGPLPLVIDLSSQRMESLKQLHRLRKTCDVSLQRKTRHVSSVSRVRFESLHTWHCTSRQINKQQAIPHEQHSEVTCFPSKKFQQYHRTSLRMPGHHYEPPSERIIITKYRQQATQRSPFTVPRSSTPDPAVTRPPRSRSVLITCNYMTITSEHDSLCGLCGS